MTKDERLQRAEMALISAEKEVTRGADPSKWLSIAEAWRLLEGDRPTTYQPTTVAAR